MSQSADSSQARLARKTALRIGQPYWAWGRQRPFTGTRFAAGGQPTATRHKPPVCRARPLYGAAQGMVAARRYTLADRIKVLPFAAGSAQVLRLSVSQFDPKRSSVFWKADIRRLA